MAATISDGISSIKVNERESRGRHTSKRRRQIKIEVRPALRSCVCDPEIRSALPKVEESFGLIRDLLASEGIRDYLRRAFIVYLISHDRPISEIVSRGETENSRTASRYDLSGLAG
ncbi:hypothetical protein A1D31_37590 [Bradyrhizobium liaoningense]|nr:hypothetical protein A1D31_37590 [Bradyrhizobium liaoningense]